MKRRAFVFSLAGALAAPLVSFAQQTQARVARIGFLGLPTAAVWASKIEALRAGLRDLGYVEGKNLVIEFRWAEGKYERLPGLAAELVRLNVDVIVTHAIGTRVAKQATTTIPIVIAATGDAVASGYVASLARPGGNVTGSTFLVPQLAAKRLELLKEAVPRARRIAILHKSDSLNPAVIDVMRVAAKSVKVELQQFGVRGTGELESAFAAMAKGRLDAVVIIEDPMLVGNAGAIVDAAAKRRIPVIGFLEFGEAGGMMAYGASIVEMHRRAATFIDKILKGAKPADLPVEQATRFELVVNRKTATALGIKIPPAILVRADKVIE